MKQQTKMIVDWSHQPSASTNFTPQQQGSKAKVVNDIVINQCSIE